MDIQRPQLFFLLAVLLGTFAVTFFIFSPFLYALVLAMVFAFVFQPIYQKILLGTHGQQWLAALVTIIFVAVFVLTPFAFLGMQIFQEAQQLYSSLASGAGKNTVLSIFNNLMSGLQQYFPQMSEFSLNIDQYLKQGLIFMIQHLGTIFGSFAKIALSIFIFLISLYYLLKDGHQLKKFFVTLSPLTDSDDEKILNRLELAVNSVVRGNLAIAVIQGFLAFLGFTIFGVPNALLWGTVAAMAAIIPSVGTALVLIPAIIFLFFTSSIFYAVGLLMWGVVVVGLVDNLLGPYLMGRGMKLHPLLILLAVLGGMAFFGPIGILLGPLTISLLLALLDIYSDMVIVKTDK